MARPSLYTPDRIEKIVTAVRLGATYGLACQYAGIDQRTFERWCHDKVGFVEQVKEAEGAGLIGWLAKIEKAANEGHWQAAAWKAERRYPQQYGRTVQEVQGKNGGPIEVVDVSDARSRLNGRMDELAARRRAHEMAQSAERTGG